MIAAVCGYMAGLIGASNSPVSGVGILAVLGASLLLVAIYGHSTDVARTNALIAYALFTTAIVFSVATISNDNLQDLKTGQLVGATPWKQQFALVLGVIFGSLVIPPVLDLLNTAFTFEGAPNAKADRARGASGGIDLVARQGRARGRSRLAVDRRRCRHRRGGDLPRRDARSRRQDAPAPLGVGMGIYLPMALTLLIPVGALIGHFYDKWARRQNNPAFAERMGTLAATGLIVGESLFGVAFAGIVGASGKDAPLAIVGKHFETIALFAAPVVFFGLIWLLYRQTKSMAR